MKRSKRRLARLCSEHGAEAVEFALVVPVLLLIVFGAIEFGRLYNVQVTLTNSARAAARVMAIETGEANPAAVDDAKAAAVANAITLNPGLNADSDVSIPVSTCSATVPITVTVKYSAPLLTGWFGKQFGTSIPLTAVAELPCGG